MVVRIASAISVAVCDQINDYVDAGSAAGELIIYDGARPATVDTAVGAQVPLVTFTLGDPAFGAASAVAAGGQATANAIAPVTADASGTAAWFRVFDSDGVAVFDGDVTDTTGNGDLKLSSTSIVSGIDVTVVSLTSLMRSGAV